MRLPIKLNLNSVLVILIGIAFLIDGVYLVSSRQYRILAVGLFLTGIANVLLGVTDGFTDNSPIGRQLFRVGIIAYLIGIPALGYGIYLNL